MPTLLTDQALWYDNGLFGQMGYAVQNFGNDFQTNNMSIAYLVDVMGRNLTFIMHSRDVDSRNPPSINTCIKIHKLIVRGRNILAGRAIAPGVSNFEGLHTSPAPQDFMIYPVPFFRVRNMFLKEWCSLLLSALSECCQHTENSNSYEISNNFAGFIGSYLSRIYRRMCVELFGISMVEALKPDFTLTDIMLSAYDPYKFFTPTEGIDTVAPVHLILTEDDAAVVTDGIPASRLINLKRWPSALPVTTGMDAVQASIDLRAATAAQLAAIHAPFMGRSPASAYADNENRAAAAAAAAGQAAVNNPNPTGAVFMPYTG